VRHRLVLVLAAVVALGCSVSATAPDADPAEDTPQPEADGDDPDPSESDDPDPSESDGPDPSDGDDPDDDTVQDGSLDDEAAADDGDGAQDDAGDAPEPYAAGPGTFTVQAGDLEVELTTDAEVTVLPLAADEHLPPMTEVQPLEGGAGVLLFEAVGHVRPGPETAGFYRPEAGIPGDVPSWLRSELPRGTSVTEGPDAVGDGWRFRAISSEDTEFFPFVLWVVDPVVNGIAPPQEADQLLHLQPLDGSWVALVSYDADELADELAATVATVAPG
jgi:hypothetical protein